VITEEFVNSCFSLILNSDAGVKKDRVLYRDIVWILDFYEKKKNIDVPMAVKNKLDCLRKICDMKLDDRTDDDAIDSIFTTIKYESLYDFIKTKRQENVSEEDRNSHIHQIRLRKRLSFLLENYDELDDMLTAIKDGSHDSMDDLVDNYEDTVKKLFINVMETNRCVEVEAAASLDMAKDEYDSLLDTILEKYSKKNIVPTGMDIFDTDVLNGGFEPSRIYIFAGSSGAGKSTIMTNFLSNVATREQPKTISVDEEVVEEEPVKDEVENVYIYVTLENTIDETFMRLYQKMFKRNTAHMIRDIKQGVNIKKKIADELKRSNSTILIRYFKAQSITPLDLTVVLDDAIAGYGKEKVKAIFVDYLDLLRSDTHFNEYRLELSSITVTLKSLAVSYNIPLITATQLGRAGYTAKDSRDLNLAQISEAIKKVEHADFVCLLSNDNTDSKKVHGKVGKNRSGKSEVSILFDVDFSTYTFNFGARVTNFKKNSDLDLETAFEGLAMVQSFTKEDVDPSTGFL